MISRRNVVAGVVVGLFPVAVLYVDSYWDPALGAFIWASWTLVGLLFVAETSEIRESRWSILHLLLVIGGAQFGVHLDLPIPEDLTIALWFLILGTGYAALLIGIRIGRVEPDGSTERAAVAAD